MIKALKEISQLSSELHEVCYVAKSLHTGGPPHELILQKLMHRLTVNFVNFAYA